MREKQIEEMWNIITTDCDNECVGCEFENDNWCFTHRVINDLYNAGYRKQEWISVEERLPENGTKCLVYTNRGKWLDKIEITHYNEGFYIEYCVVTHWMPLPEPPMMKGSGNESIR